MFSWKLGVAVGGLAAMVGVVVGVSGNPTLRPSSDVGIINSASAETPSHQPALIADKKTQGAIGVSEKAARDKVSLVPVKWDWSDPASGDGVRRVTGKHPLGFVTLSGPENNLADISYIGIVATKEADGLTDDEFNYWLQAHLYICAAILKVAYPKWEKSGEWLMSNLPQIMKNDGSSSYSSGGKLAKLSFFRSTRMISLYISPE